MPLVVVILKDDGEGILTPLSPAQVTKFGHHEPPLPPLPQVIIHLSRSDLSSTVNKQCFGHGFQMAFFEALVGPNTSLDESTHLVKHKCGHERKPFDGPLHPCLSLRHLGFHGRIHGGKIILHKHGTGRINRRYWHLQL